MLFFAVFAWIISIVSFLLPGGSALLSFLQPSKSSSSGGKTVAVTGASGLLGKELVAALRSRNYIVRQITTGKSDVSKGIYSWSPGAPGKVTSSGTLSGDPGFIDKEALEGCDAVVHLAGENIASGDSSAGPLAILGRWTDSKKDKIMSSRVLGTRLIANEMKSLRKKPTTFICASAVGLYGYEDSETLFTEKGKKGAGFLADVVENWEKEAVKSPTKRTALMRLSVILSKKGGVVGKLLPLFYLAAGGNFGSGKQAFSWVSVDDAVSAILYTLENPRLQGAINVCSPQPATNEIFTQALAAAVNRPAIVPLPESVGKLIFGQFGEETILGGQKCVPEKLKSSGFEFQDADIFKALKRIIA